MMGPVFDSGNDIGHMWDGWGMGWGWTGGWMMLIWVLILGLVVWGIVALTRSSAPRRRGDGAAKDTLDQRFAAGQIDEAEYRRARQVLDEQGRRRR